MKIITECRWRMPSYFWVSKTDINILLEFVLHAEKKGWELKNTKTFRFAKTIGNPGWPIKPSHFNDFCVHRTISITILLLSPHRYNMGLPIDIIVSEISRFLRF